MTRDPLASFAEIDSPGTAPKKKTDDDFYPGSKRKRRAVAGPVDPWDDVPYIELKHRGVPTRFYTIGVLADALERKPPAIRKWERLGYLPKPRITTPGRTYHGQQRLYTRELIEGIVKIAGEEGLTGAANRNVSATRFEERVRELFKELNA